MPLRRLGVQAVVEGMPSFTKSIHEIEKSIERASNNIQKFASQTGITGAGAREATSAAHGLAGSLNVVSVAAVAAVAGLVAVAASFAGLVALATHGAALRGITDSFDALNRSLELTPGLLDRMRESSVGTISDIDLISKANLALAGTTGQMAREFADSIPKLLEIARVQSIATGHGVEYLFNSLIFGVKRSSPLLIDNTGIVIRVGQATEAYAKSIGKAADQLTAEEHRLAVLHAVLEAGGIAVGTYGNIHETAAIKISRANATLQNMLNTLSLALQPAFEAALDRMNNFLSFLSDLASAAAPYLTALGEIFTETFTNIMQPLYDALGVLDAGEIAKRFFTGGARIVGSLAGGLAYAANKYVLPVIISIAEALASFLSGESPPPKGPLSTIDIGGANVMKAWLSGFLGVALDPVEKVAGQVADMMGSIFTATREQVEARLKQLDEALQPFQDRLAIIKSQFDALKAPVEAAFSSIERQMEKSLKALNKGIQGSDIMIRSLDAQRDALEGYVDAQQAQIDNAQIQLSLAQAQQAEERTMLEIRQRMLGPLEKVARVAQEAAPRPRKGGGGGGAKPEKGGGGKKPSTEGGTRAVADVTGARGQLEEAFAGGFEGAGGDIEELGVNVERVKKAGSKIGESVGKFGDRLNKAFADLFDPEKLSETLVTNLSNFVTKILDKIVGFLNQFGPGKISDGVRTMISNGILLLGDAASLVGGLAQSIGNGIQNWLATNGPQKLIDGLLAAFGKVARVAGELVVGLAQGLMQGIEDWVAKQGPQKVINGLITLLASVALSAATLVAELATSLVTEIVNWIKTNGPEKFSKGIGDALNSIVKDAASIVTQLAAALAQGIGDFLGGEGQKDFKRGLGNAIKGLIEWATVGNGPRQLTQLGSDLAVGILKGLVDLVVGIAQAVVDGIAEGIRAFREGRAPKQPGVPAIDISGTKPLAGLGSAYDPRTGELILPPLPKDTLDRLIPDDATIERYRIKFGDKVGSIGAGAIDAINDELASKGSQVTTQLQTVIGNAFTAATEVAYNAAGVLVSSVESRMTTDFPISLSAVFTTVSGWITTTGMNILKTAFATAITSGPVAHLLGAGTSEIVGAFSSMIAAVDTWVKGEGGAAITNVGKAVAKALADPMTAIGAAIKGSVIKALRDIIAAVKGSGLLLFVPQLGAMISAFEKTLAGLVGAATGGLFSKGLLRVGERGEELVSSASKLSVFPSSFVRSMDRLTEVLAQPSAMFGTRASYNYVYNQQQQMGNVNFNGVSGMNDALQRYAAIRAMRRPR